MIGLGPSGNRNRISRSRRSPFGIKRRHTIPQAYSSDALSGDIDCTSIIYLPPLFEPDTLDYKDK